jgi:hypothetical protein
MFRLNRKAQSTLEYAVLIFVVVGALITMQIYMKRGISGRIRASSDDIGQQFSPGATRAQYNTTRTTNTTEYFGIDEFGAEKKGVTHRKFNVDSTNRTGSETVETYDKEYDPYK